MRFAWRAVVVSGVGGRRWRRGASSRATVRRLRASAAAGELKTFPIRGKIVSVDAAKGSIVLDHEAVPGFMDAMTMTVQAEGSERGQRTASGRPDYGEAAGAQGRGRLRRRDAGRDCGDGAGEAGLQAGVQYHVPTAGDAVPDFKLMNENGTDDSSGPVQGAGGAADVYLYALPAGGLLPADEQELCADRPGAGGGPEAVCEDASAEHQLRPEVRHAGDPEELWRDLYRRHGRRRLRTGTLPRRRRTSCRRWSSSSTWA